jgi:hypothetical protein
MQRVTRLSVIVGLKVSLLTIEVFHLFVVLGLLTLAIDNSLHVISKFSCSIYILFRRRRSPLFRLANLLSPIYMVCIT